MASALFKLGDDAFVEWSTTVDAPVSWVMTKAEAVARYPSEIVERADRLGHSFGDTDQARTPDELIASNRAGPDETCLPLGELLATYADRDAYDAVTRERQER